MAALELTPPFAVPTLLGIGIEIASIYGIDRKSEGSREFQHPVTILLPKKAFNALAAGGTDASAVEARAMRIVVEAIRK